MENELKWKGVINMSEKAELREDIVSQIYTIKNKTKQERISKLLEELNALVNGKDSKLQNLLDAFTLFFIKCNKKKMVHLVDDILDKYDKTDKDGNPIYSTEIKNKIKRTFEDIIKICQEDFWDRFRIVIKGS